LIPSRALRTHNKTHVINCQEEELIKIDKSKIEKKNKEGKTILVTGRGDT
jgi:hypothetical protein